MPSVIVRLKSPGIPKSLVRVATIGDRTPIILGYVPKELIKELKSDQNVSSVEIVKWLRKYLRDWGFDKNNVQTK